MKSIVIQSYPNNAEILKSGNILQTHLIAKRILLYRKEVPKDEQRERLQ
jgi:hypothetical protein